MASLVVERYGYVEQGYTARISLIALTAASVMRNSRARVAYIGVGLLWTMVEIILVATSTRTGPMTLGPSWGWIVLGGVVRGFSEGAAIIGIAMMRNAPTSRAAIAVLLASAALVDDDMILVSTREVVAPLGLSVSLCISCIYLLRVATGRSLVPLTVTRWATAVAFAWNVVAFVYGSRRVQPPQWTLFFILYDAFVEVALLYAGLAEIVLWVVTTLQPPYQSPRAQPRVPRRITAAPAQKQSQKITVSMARSTTRGRTQSCSETRLR